MDQMVSQYLDQDSTLTKMLRVDRVLPQMANPEKDQLDHLAQDLGVCTLPHSERH